MAYHSPDASDPAVTERVLERVRRIATGQVDDELSVLTAQERKILMLVAEGKTNKEIAADVFLSEAAFLEGPGLPPDIHLTARQAGAYANRAGVGSLVLTHLVPGNSADDARAEAASEFAGVLDVAAAGQVIDLG